MRVQVDEAGRDNEVSRVDLPRRLAPASGQSPRCDRRDRDIPVNQGLPVPSTMRPPRISRS